jgi:hydroxyacylglutathione hydrolase
MMWQSLVKIRNLPADTQLYCGHEYTAANVHFALTIEPKNSALRARAEEVVRLIEKKRPTIPTTIQQEKSYNPFLRADLHSVAGAINMEGANPESVFATIRARKDKF